ncbi:hypothetical protein [Paracoccus pacificus]|uniref:NfeD-like C-terminal, partner-binding n=1 Tax=Paracoccus pacificus TaxID=1463598 RepID=A0ABW4R3I7_9RHOB
MSWHDGWLWLIAALVLALLEIVVPGFLFLGIAIGTGIIGLLMVLGAWTASIPVSLVVCAILSGVAWFALRRWVGVRKGQVRIWHRDINDN